ncbi:hypothetical protein BKA65DRAFT_396115 [Rhexocercosporidium sp. MPI-PUGE-AT-0058]|nr:hypothetical protein BKA65DRAFT_396115 [Rhexocercosporidium sp. MPI-PUGE-AT-0058]
MTDYGNMPFSFECQHFFDTNSNSDDQLGEDLASMDWNNMNNIDPSLDKLSFQAGTRSQPPMSFLQQQQQQQPPTMQRFVNEPQRQLFTAPNLPRELLHGSMAHNSVPTSSLPRVSHQRMPSPSLSHDLTSSTGSAESPPADQDYYPENQYYGVDNSYYRQSLPDLQVGPSSYQSYSVPQNHGFSCVSMDQVQGFADTEDIYYENNDEGFGEVAMKSEYTDVDHHHIQTSMKTSGESQSYRYPSDEGIGASIQDEGSPKSTILVDDGRTSDIDAEGDMEEMDAEHIPSTPASDTEYTPKATRTRKRRASPNTRAIAPSTKRSRITKAPHKTKGQVTCKSCNHAPFKDVAALQKHVASAHTRAFVCVFDFAGCTSTFASKNEWKRHVSSQHLNLSAWVCELGTCGTNHSKAGHSMSNPNGAITRGSEFNRKDLYTQHLRRMHVPLPVKRKKVGTDAAWEDNIKNLQQTCLKTKRQAPTHLECPVHGCSTTFDGTGCWDDRMEHVAKHLEAQALGKGVVRQGDDNYLLSWALQEGIIENKVNGGFRLVLGGGGGAGGRRAVKTEHVDEEEDAEGEDE